MHARATTRCAHAFRERDASELSLHLLYLGATTQDDWQTPYKNIVALGPNAATLHHVAYGIAGKTRGPDGAESLLVDAGATCRGYCADITRTWVKGRGASASAFAHLVAGVEAMQRRLCTAIRVGMAYEDLHDESHRQTAEVLREVGIVRSSIDEAVAAGITRAFYPHGLGHSLGLQTHDVGLRRCGKSVRETPSSATRPTSRPARSSRSNRASTSSRTCSDRSARARTRISSTGRPSTPSPRSEGSASRTTCTSPAATRPSAT